MITCPIGRYICKALKVQSKRKKQNKSIQTKADEPKNKMTADKSRHVFKATTPFVTRKQVGLYKAVMQQ